MKESAVRVAKFALAVLQFIILLPFTSVILVMMAGAAAISGIVARFVVLCFFVPHGVPEEAADYFGWAAGLLVFASYLRSVFLDGEGTS